MEEEQKKKIRLNKQEERRAVRYSFDSLLDLVDWVEGDFLREGESLSQDRKGWYSHGDMEKSFCPLSWKEATEEAQYGEAKKAKSFSQIVEEISSRMETEVPKWTHDVTGQCLDVGAYCAGEPECFLRRAPKPAVKSIPVYVDMSMHCNITAQTILTRAAAITALVDELQTMGWIVDLHICSRIHIYGQPKSLIVDVAVDCRPVDVNILSFLCSPAFLRRYVLACLEHYAGKDRPNGGSYGRGEQLDRIDEPGFFFVGAYDSAWSSYWWQNEEKAKDHVVEMIQRYLEPAEGHEMEVVVG